MGGPMPSLASGKISCTAWANTWAAEWRMTLRPSSVSAATGMTSTSASGTHDRSRSRPSRSRTTTTAAGSPRPGSPASRTASPAVVPAATRIGAAGAGLTTALIGVSPLGRRFSGVVERDHAIGAGRQDPKPIGLFSQGQSKPKSSAVQSAAPSSHRVPTTISAVRMPPRTWTDQCRAWNQSITLS